MKICIIGDYSPNLDEGLKNIATYLAEGLSTRHSVVRLNVKNVFGRAFWRGLAECRAEIIHYVPGPTIKSFILVKFLQLLTGAKTVMSAPQPFLPAAFKTAIGLLRPNLVLAQSAEWEAMFKNLGCRTALLPNGVDVERFVPVSRAVKKQLRDRYGVESDRFVVLHVGPLTKRRNLYVLGRFQTEDTKVVIIGSRYQRIDRQLYRYLCERGCMVLDGYYQNIEEIYALSDCYVFPVQKGNTILCPLSVLEAMSCNLPVLSSRFDGLVTLFNDGGDGLAFADKEEDLFCALDGMKRNPVEVRTRDKVTPYSWARIVAKLEEIYGGLSI